MTPTMRAVPGTPAGRPVFRTGQRLSPHALNAVVDRMEYLARSLDAIDGSAARILSAPPDEPLTELVTGASGGYRLRLSAFVVVVMGDLLDLSALTDAERSLPLPEIPARIATVRLFLEVRSRRIVVAPTPARGLATPETAAASTSPCAYLLDMPVPFLTTGATTSDGAIEIARIRFEDGAPVLVSDFVPAMAALGSVPEVPRLISRHLATVFRLSDMAVGALAERDDLSPSRRWKLGALAASAREIRSVLADGGRRPADAYRVIATVLAETLHAMGAARTDIRRAWPEHLWSAGHSVSEALALDTFREAGEALLGETSWDFPGWVALTVPALRVASTQDNIEITGELGLALSQLVGPPGSGCRGLLVEVRADVPLMVSGPVVFHPTKSRIRLPRRFGDIVPQRHEDGLGFEFEIDFADNPPAAVAEAAREVLSSSRLRLGFCGKRVTTPAGDSETSTGTLPGLRIRLRGVQ